MTSIKGYERYLGVLFSVHLLIRRIASLYIVYCNENYTTYSCIYLRLLNYISLPCFY